MSISIQQISYKTWGRCVCISNGKVEAYITVDLGPRIIRYGFVGKENMLFENESRSIRNYDENYKVFGENDGWYIYGGHRIWAAPELSPRTYYPDNESVNYTITDNGAVFMPKQQNYTAFQNELEVSMCEKSGKLKVNNKITNNGAWEARFSVWAITVMSQHGLEVIPNPDKDNALLHNRNLSLWSYAKMNDKRVCWGDKFITLKQDTGSDCAFKFGINNEKGYAMYFNHNCMFVKKYAHNDKAVYPDANVSYETYTDQNILEMETLSPLKKVMPKETVCHEEVWELYENIPNPHNNEEEFIKMTNLFIK